MTGASFALHGRLGARRGSGLDFAAFELKFYTNFIHINEFHKLK
jgi:hypothetical protein